MASNVFLWTNKTVVFSYQGNIMSELVISLSCPVVHSLVSYSDAWHISLIVPLLALTSTLARPNVFHTDWAEKTLHPTTTGWQPVAYHWNEYTISGLLKHMKKQQKFKTPRSCSCQQIKVAFLCFL